MCGIAGKLWLDPERPADRDVVAAMTAALAHRGPDDSGSAADGPIALGHRRLSVVDLSPRGRQPMAFADGRVLLVANGEIYNHVALRAQLRAGGHDFAGECDSEVIGAAYLRWWDAEGPRFVRRLDGMFAFALWDGRARRLILARDRTGQKPLVYAHGPEALSFASELSALARDPSLDRRPDWGALSDFLAFRVVPHPRTAWAGAAKLPPASVLVLQDGRARVERYWRLAPGPDDAAPPPPEEAARLVRDALERAVRRRMMSDVPVGCLLSGGVDSSAVLAFMARHHDGPVASFTIGFDDPAYDERADARAVARHFGAEHHEQLVQPDAATLLDDVLARFGEPFADASALPTFLVARLARSHVKVALGGDGGDESFAGYDRHRALELSRALARWWLAPLRAAVDAIVPGRGGGGHRSAWVRARRLLDALPAAPRRRNHLWRLAMDEVTRATLLTPEGHERLGPPSFYGHDAPLPFPLNEALLLDVERYLPDDLLVKLDVASMAHGLEARSPFLDHELMELAASLPGRLKLHGGRGKRVLRAALRGVLPPDVLRRRKRGFGVPLDAWFRGPLLGHLREVLLSSRARTRGLFRPDRLEALIDDHARGRVAAHETLYTLLVLERWFLREEGDVRAETRPRAQDGVPTEGGA